MAYFTHVNQMGGVAGRRIVVKTYDDGYQPNPSVENTVRLILEDRVFALFGYVGTPTVTRVLPLLKKFQDERTYLFFRSRGPNRRGNRHMATLRSTCAPPIGRRQPGWSTISWPSAAGASACCTRPMPMDAAGGQGSGAHLPHTVWRLLVEATYRRGQRFSAVMRPQVEILKESRPDAIICIGAYAACAAFLRDAVDLGLQVPIANLSFVGSENLLNLIAESQEDVGRYTRMLVNSQVVPSYEDSGIPAVREYRELMEQFDPQPPAELLNEAYTPFSAQFCQPGGIPRRKAHGRDTAPSWRRAEPVRAGGRSFFDQGIRPWHR